MNDRDEFEKWYANNFNRRPTEVGYETDICWQAWQAARASHGNCQGIPDSSACEVPEGLDATQEEWARINGRKHIPDATKMITGNAVVMGQLSQFGETYSPAMLIEFASVEDFNAARESGQCRFTVFGGEV